MSIVARNGLPGARFITCSKSRFLRVFVTNETATVIFPFRNLCYNTQPKVVQVHSNWNLTPGELARWLQLNREATGLVYSTAAN